MKKQLTIIGMIGILIIISISGCLENNKGDNGSITPLSGKVTITTNKSEYGQNETINITLYNGLNVSIYSYIAGSAQGYFIEQVEKKTQKGWLAYRPVYLESYVAYMGEVKPGESFSFEWEPLIWVNGTYSNDYVYEESKLEPGIYRISSTPVTSDYFVVDPVENNSWRTVYSNEFTIKEENTSHETFTVYEGWQKTHYNITVYNVSIPLDKSEAVLVYEAIMGSKPRLWIGDKEIEPIILQTNDGWEIQYGAYIVATSFFQINEQNRTIRIIPGI
jgi:hypothetical protein